MNCPTTARLPDFLDPEEVEGSCRAAMASWMLLSMAGRESDCVVALRLVRFGGGVCRRAGSHVIDIWKLSQAPMGVMEEASWGQKRMGMLINHEEGDKRKFRGDSLR